MSKDFPAMETHASPARANTPSRRWLPAGVVFLSLGILPPASTARPEQLGLPVLPAAVAASPTMAALGRTLFFDKRLSADGRISCASCHQPERAFSDGRALAQGIGGRLGTRNTPTLLNAAFNTSQFWDGRRVTLEEQALDPFVQPREHGLSSHRALLDRLRRDGAYLKAFRAAFPRDAATNAGANAGAIQIEHVGRALASFERTLSAAGSPFDRYRYQGEESALAPAAKRGLLLFQGRAQCASCHVIGPENAIFTDNQFHGLSVGLSRIAQRLPALTTGLVQMRGQGKPLDQAVLSDEDVAELGRFAVTLQPADIGKFRTPSLRNVALTAPYMHDGSIATLEEAVELEIYYRSAESGHPLILTPLEKADLLEFLRALDSPAARRFSAPAPARARAPTRAQAPARTRGRSPE